MNAILLLKEKAEPTDRVSHDLKQPTRDDDDATPGCTCDRWGHPCAVVLRSNRRREPYAQNFRW